LGPEVLNENNERLSKAFSGGMLYPRFAGLDMNNDGLEDILAIDYSNYELSVFIATKQNGAVSYHFDNRYADYIPDLYAWIITYDYNHDGKKDLFTYASSGAALSVYKNVSDAQGVSFELIAQELKYRDGNFDYSVRVITNDIPVIEDIDGDGDMDILTFDNAGANVTFYQNQGVELHGNADTLDFLVATDCWGRFQEEDSTHLIRFAPTCLFDKAQGSNRHQGSNMLALDSDEDGDMDILLSDVDYEYVTLLENGWNPKSSSGHNRDTIIAAYPEYPKPESFDVSVFPSLNYLDVDNDGVRDLLLAPSHSKGTFSTVNTWLYKNYGKDNKPDFRLEEYGFLQKDMLDLGEFSRPQFFDYDGDGDQDLFVGAPLPQIENQIDSVVYRIVLFENTGSSSQASFKFKDNDYLGLSKLGLVSFSHAFGDANNDGTIDLLLGTLRGRITFFSNKNAPHLAADFRPKRTVFMKVDVRGQSAPQVFDLNSDRKNDLLVGDELGFLSYYEWVNDTLILKDSTFGGIELHTDSLGGYATPVIGDFDDDDKNELMVAASGGGVFYYDDIDLSRKKFPSTRVIHNDLTDWYAGEDLGSNTQLSTADLDGDGLHELLVGGRRGGLLFYEPDFILFDAIANGYVDKPTLELYPNPNKGSFFIGGDWLEQESYVLRIYGLDGRMCSEQELEGERIVHTDQLRSGVYMAVVTLNSGLSISQEFLVD